MKRGTLQLVEWVDSRRPRSSWEFVSFDMFEGKVVVFSVGWVLRSDADLIVLAPNFADIQEETPQVNGVIEIPRPCVVKSTQLESTDTPLVPGVRKCLSTIL